MVHRYVAKRFSSHSIINEVSTENVSAEDVEALQSSIQVYIYMYIIQILFEQTCGFFNI